MKTSPSIVVPGWNSLSSAKKKSYYKITLILILLLAFLLRAPEIFSKNYLFGFDQGRDYLLVKEMVENLKPRLIGAEVGAGFAGLSGIFHGPFYLYLLTLFYIVFQGNPYGGLVMVFIFGMATVILSYFLTKKMFGRKWALVFTFLVSISPQIAPQARFLWNHHPSSLFIILVMYFVYLIPKNIRKYFSLSIFIAGFIYNFELAIAVPLVGAIILHAIFILKIKDPRAYLYGVASLFLAFSPFFLFELRHHLLGLRGFIGYFLSAAKTTTLIFEQSMFKDHFVSYWNNAVSSFLFDFVLQNIFLQYSFFICLILGLYLSWRKLKQEVLMEKFIKFLLLLTAFTWAFFLLLKNTIWDYYLLHLHFAYLFLLVFVLSSLFKNKNIAGRKLLLSVFMLYLLFMGFGAIKRVYWNWQFDYFDYGGGAKIAGKLDAIDFIYRDAGKEKFNVLVFMPPVYTYPYDYLFKWYGEKQYNFIPGREKKGIFYLLIDPDPSQPWSYKGWQETVVRTGKVLWTRALPSGLIIQKRIGGTEERYTR